MTTKRKHNDNLRFTKDGNDSVYIKMDDLTVRNMKAKNNLTIGKWINLTYVYSLANDFLRKRLDRIMELHVHNKIKPFPIDGEIDDCEWFGFGNSHKTRLKD